MPWLLIVIAGDGYRVHRSAHATEQAAYVAGRAWRLKGLIVNVGRRD